jgi:hypothetical protein
MTAEDKRRRASYWLLPLGLVLISVLLFLVVWLIRAADRQVTDYKDAAFQQQTNPGYNRFGLLGTETLSEEPIQDTEFALIYADRIVHRFSVREDAAEGFALRLQALRKLAGEEARIVAIPAPKRAQFEPDCAESADEAYDSLMAELAAMLPSDILLQDIRGDLAGDSEHFLYYRTQDTWTMDGAYYGYKAVCSALGLEPRDIDYFDYYNVNRFTGDLEMTLLQQSADIDPVTVAALAGIPGDPFIFRYAKNFKNYETVMTITDGEYKRPAISHVLGGDSGIIGAWVIKAQLYGNGRGSILVLGDSMGQSVVPYLTENFRDIFFVHIENGTADVLKELISESGVGTIVVIQAADRIGNESYSLTLNGLLG